ncbi:hypothetical protein DPMN_162053 [Dreissena polymorpha]|uniref:Uncharacterized protein n=1 Tax=Dreissena polymorpha TaxID=45954 RepID=A0A9D4ITA7_DREPO|nr:hypothetical protein DPMN_162053 [Dreissena polymorpha]
MGHLTPGCLCLMKSLSKAFRVGPPSDSDEHKSENHLQSWTPSDLDDVQSENHLQNSTTFRVG